MKPSPASSGQQAEEGGEKRCLNSELWHACAGPLVCLPTVGTQVVYFPQGHSEQVAASTNKEVEGHIPNYPSLSPQLICQLHNVTMHADPETDEVYAQLTLQPPSPEEQKDTYIPIDMGPASKQPTNYFCKTLTASDTSTHGGFSVPRRAAEKVFPPLDFSQQPPAQELIASDLHDVEWKFRHIFRGQPKRHLLTTGWSVFVSAKRLVAGDSVLFIWNEKNQLLLGIRRACRPQTVMPSSVLSSESMQIGLLAAAAHAAAAHAAATNSRFTVFYNPRACPSEFVIPLCKYVKAVFHTRVSVGMRFRMLFETEESSVRRYMGTITGICDLDPLCWSNSHWRSVKVGWDESTAGERQPRVSLWEIEPLTTVPMYPSLFPLRLKRPWQPGLPFSHVLDNREDENATLMWFRADAGERGLPLMNIQSSMGPWFQQRFEPKMVVNEHDQQFMHDAALSNIRGDLLKQQLVQYQQPFQFQLPSDKHISLSQQPIALQTESQHFFSSQFSDVSGKRNDILEQSHREQKKQQVQQPHAFGQVFQNPVEDLQHQQSPLLFQMKQNLDLPELCTNHSVSLPPDCLQSMMDSSCPEGSSNVLNLCSLREPMAEQSHQLWERKDIMYHATHSRNSAFPPCLDRNGVLETENCTACSHSSALFGVAVDSHNFFSIAAPTPNLSTSSFESDIPEEPYSASCIQNSLYGLPDESSGLLQNSGEIDPLTKTFVEVYKSGSVGRSLDISQFSSYNELRNELGQMFGIEDQLEDPFRSGWQLLFVDRENDVLLLGDGPWESFVNSVWYIKILSPEDVQRMG